MNNFATGSSQDSMNTIIQPLLTDLYQITMAYAYWKSEKVKDFAVFDLFFRRNPFCGEFTIFAGLDDCLHFLERFHFSDSDIEYLRTILPDTIEKEFFTYLKNLTANDITLYALPEGSVVFPRTPLMRIEGPLIVAQLLETTLLNLINFASLMATNAARYKIAAGDVMCVEFGLRRAQGPDGALSASKYSYIGGFEGTSNVLAGKLYNIPVKGTHAHSFVTSFHDTSLLSNKYLAPKSGDKPIDILELAMKYRADVAKILKVVLTEVNDGELAAFVAFAASFPNGFIALVDTYDVKKSGLINFCAVALAINDVGYKSIGIRIDSGDLAYLSKVARGYFTDIGKIYNIPWFEKLLIMASNDINEETILSLNEQEHKIDCFAIGTHLVTCQRQPALGCVYKLVEVNGQARMKLSQDVGKVIIPGKKDLYRLYSKSGDALIDLMQNSDESPPAENKKVLCRHPFEESKRAFVIPSKVEAMLKIYWKDGKVQQNLPNLKTVRETVKESLKSIRSDIKRNLNPTPYKVSVSDSLYTFLHTLWLENAPIGELS
ncbi:Nicotinate phosphoribosyltransferase C-terminal domain [Popillia japonica]|uniref:Nicotinate phosphoribosyltransferase n=1 Tax=Popillia japonica TaxID=7064 RepID=A0AAW1N368_POPJA